MTDKQKRDIAKIIWYAATPWGVVYDRKEVSLLKGWVDAAIEGLEAHRAYEKQQLANKMRRSNG